MAADKSGNGGGPHVIFRTTDSLTHTVAEQVRTLTPDPDTPTLADVVTAGLNFHMSAERARQFNALVGDVYLLTGATLPCCADCDDPLLEQWMRTVNAALNPGAVPA
jgi:hypothetical protein